MRVNPASTAHFADDLAALAADRLPHRDARQVRGHRRPRRTSSDFEVIALCETARGVLARRRRGRAARTSRRSCGAPRTSSRRSAARRAGTPTAAIATSRRYARSQVLLAAGAHGSRRDRRRAPRHRATSTGLRAEAEDAAALGFAATACIHPSQVAVVREAYRPDAERLEWARAVLAAAAVRAPASSRSAARWSTRPCCARRRRSCVAPAAPERDAPIPVLRCERHNTTSAPFRGHADVQAQTIR